MSSEPERIAVVTGASTGIGRATAEALAGLGYRLVLVSRDTERSKAALARITAKASVPVEAREVDLSLMAEVRALANELNRLPRIDVLVNCAGAFYGKRRETAEGHEMTWAINHLAPFALSLSVYDLLARSAGRVVNLCTRFYGSGRIDFDDIESVKRYRPLGAYANAKLANLVFTRELQRRCGGGSVRVNAVQPGDVYTNAAQNSGWLLRAAYRVIGPIFFLSPERGADSVVWAATAGDAPAGKLIYRRQVREPTEASTDPELARRLWELTEQQTGVRRDSF